MNKPITITLNDEHGQPQTKSARLKWITRSKVAKQFDTCGIELIEGRPIIALLSEITKA